MVIMVLSLLLSLFSSIFPVCPPLLQWQDVEGQLENCDRTVNCHTSSLPTFLKPFLPYFLPFFLTSRLPRVSNSALYSGQNVLLAFRRFYDGILSLTNSVSKAILNNNVVINRKWKVHVHTVYLITGA